MDLSYTPQIHLRPTLIADFETFFRIQQDEEANYLAAFTPKDALDITAFTEKWTRFLANPTLNMRTIIAGNDIAGSIGKYETEGHAEITYWIDKSYWGKGIATAALKCFLKIETSRPMYGRTAFDNYGSQRVLEKCGFQKAGTDSGYANARQCVIEEFIYILA